MEKLREHANSTFLVWGGKERGEKVSARGGGRLWGECSCEGVRAARADAVTLHEDGGKV